MWYHGGLTVVAETFHFLSGNRSDRARSMQQLVGSTPHRSETPRCTNTGRPASFGHGDSGCTNGHGSCIFVVKSLTTNDLTDTCSHRMCAHTTRGNRGTRYGLFGLTVLLRDACLCADFGFAAERCRVVYAAMCKFVGSHVFFCSQLFLTCDVISLSCGMSRTSKPSSSHFFCLRPIRPIGVAV